MRWLRWCDPEDVKVACDTSVSLTRRRADRILKVLSEHCPDGQTMDTDRFKRFAVSLRKVISDTAAVSVILGELAAIVGTQLSEADRIRLACSVAGGFATGRATGSIGIMASNVSPIWCLARVIGVSELVTPDGEAVTNLRFLACNSVFAGSEFSGVLRRTSARRWAKLLRLCNPRSGLQWGHPEQFLDAWCLSHLSKFSGQVEFNAISVTKAVASKNTTIAKARYRKFQKCPFGASYDCVECGVGRNQCDRSLRAIETNFPLS